ncbi:MAG: polyphosphate kinase [Thermodesulfobacteriota bacterium]
MRKKNIKKSEYKKIENPYKGISLKDYHIEKRRLQLELLDIQQNLIKKNHRLCITFDGRDAAGKGSTILRFTENLMPQYYRVVELGIPTKKESKYWFRRYEKHLPNPGEIVFFDRSWYNRATIEPTMGYCSQKQYEYFISKVLDWEHELIDKGTKLIKFYLSVDSEHQLGRFQERLSDPLKFWKFSQNDLHARKKWETYTNYKNQMFTHTSSKKSPWYNVDANIKIEARLNCMLQVVNKYSNRKYIPLTGVDVVNKYSIEINGIVFDNLSQLQYSTLKEEFKSKNA